MAAADSEVHKMVMNIGKRPTFDDKGKLPCCAALRCAVLCQKQRPPSSSTSFYACC